MQCKYTISDEMKGQIPIHDLRSIPTVSIIKAKIPVSDLNRTPTVSIIMIHIPVSDLSRTLNNKYNKEPDGIRIYISLITCFRILLINS